MSETINDKAVSTLLVLKQTEELISNVKSDYGEATGFCDDHDQLVQDVSDMLGSIRCRASRLTQRIQRHQRAESLSLLAKPKPTS